VRYAVGAKLVSGIAKRIFVLLGRVPRAIRATDVTTSLAHLDSRGKEMLALVAGPSHTLSRFLINKVLPTHFAGSLENIDLGPIEVVVGDDRRSLFV
jgi:hypothetical protein